MTEMGYGRLLPEYQERYTLPTPVMYTLARTRHTW